MVSGDDEHADKELYDLVPNKVEHRRRDGRHRCPFGDGSVPDLPKGICDEREILLMKLVPSFLTRNLLPPGPPPSRAHLLIIGQ